MIGASREALKQEVEMCRKLYPGFQEAANVISAVFDAENRFYRETPHATIACHYGGTSEDIRRKFINDQSLALGSVEIKSSSFKKLISSLTGEISRSIPEMQETMKELDDFLTLEIPMVKETTSKEEVKQLRDKSVEHTSLEDDLATFLFCFGLSSLFRRTLEGLTGQLDTSPWRRGDCPVCEEIPHYGTLRKNDGAKILECWLCGTRWQHSRVQCPGCSSSDQEKLGLFTVEDGKVCRVHFCHDCKGYYKIIDGKSLEKEEIILYLHHLATLSHDLLAQKEGFSPVSGLEWINREELSGVNNLNTKH